MAFFTYDLPIPASEIDTKTLERPYFVQLAPDGSHLVPGQLQQDFKPSIGQWLEVGKITRNLSGRYFVQYTDDSTLVVGSLVQGTRFPQGQWKEVKRLPFPEFHRILFEDGGYIQIHNDHVNPDGFMSPYSFSNFILLPILDAIQPGVYSESVPASVQLFYFAGTFAELDNDASKLKAFGEPDSYFTFYDSVAHTDTSFLVTNTNWSGFQFLIARPFAADGYYSLVVKVLPHAGTPAYYVVIDNGMRRYEFPYN